MEIEYREVFHDYEQGLAYARQENQPVLLYFTGYGCVNCRKMEAYVIADERVQEALQKYVVVELYVDSRQDENHNGIPDGEEFSRLQRERFHSNAQPLYLHLTPQGEVIGIPIAYTADADIFLQWLHSAE